MSQCHPSALLAAVDFPLDPATPRRVGYRDALGINNASAVPSPKLFDE